jgi:hypothetical protein
MRRLCGRPGCSDAASVTYGMRPEDLVFWIDALPDPVDDDAAVLCRRHADAMVVPRGWTLDDLRDPDLHLFRPPLPAPTPRQRVTRHRREPAVAEQLQLGVQPDSLPEDEASAVGDAIDDDDAGAAPWAPSFDEADDLDGLLSARSPLLSRAFRTAERPAE